MVTRERYYLFRYPSCVTLAFIRFTNGRSVIGKCNQENETFKEAKGRELAKEDALSKR